MKFLILAITFWVSISSAQQRVYSAQTIQLYMNQLSSTLVGRQLNDAEIAAITSGRQSAVPTILRSWLNDPKLAESARVMIELQFGISGSKDGVDWGYPGYLARHIVRNNMPYSSIITSDFCVNAADQRVACDSGAPFNAGILTTRGFLLALANRYSLKRGHTMIREFACMTYPLPRELEPSVPRSQLIPVFQADVNGGTDFGNGTSCYSCHSQFSSHAQFFIKFDKFGRYQPSATGIQAPGGVEPGISTNDTFSSHFSSPTRAGQEHSVILGKPAANLREAAIILANHPKFLNCSIRNTLQYVLKMSRVDKTAIPEVLIQKLADKVKAINPDPTWQNILEVVFADSLVIESALRAGESR